MDTTLQSRYAIPPIWIHIPQHTSGVKATFHICHKQGVARRQIGRQSHHSPQHQTHISRTEHHHCHHGVNAKTAQESSLTDALSSTTPSTSSHSEDSAERMTICPGLIESHYQALRKACEEYEAMRHSHQPSKHRRHIQHGGEKRCRRCGGIKKTCVCECKQCCCAQCRHH
eukprot:Blabericola_migrator_1__2835@NODE_180_length_11882_cov_134_948540_g18_i1_p7_GENE_NODE_180_length_11882_cov_134_948540_g18_i1NODE_180_length_11882_cov_134_948540_g18_i1_p7_ORF_typecomplete_len171_score13_36ADIP/PF11559_8/0_096_NODE_180_length_11882_cov_134_948540_g18_i148205332